MAKPVIWTVDDDPDVLRAVERDLRRQYGNRYRVMAADSGAGALESVKQLKLRNDPVALFLVDQRHSDSGAPLVAALQSDEGFSGEEFHSVPIVGRRDG